MAALSGPLSKRRLGTRSGELMRLSRRAETPGAKAAFETEALKARAGEGSAISSSEGNIATADYERRAAQGLARARMGLLTTAATGGLLEARQKLFDEAKAAGGFDDAMRSRARSLGVTDSGLAMAERKIPQDKIKSGGDNDGNGIPDLIQRPAANTPTANPETTGSVAGKSAATETPLGLPIIGGVLDAVPPRPREGRINGMPASKALASMRRPDISAPGNMEDIKARDAADREAAINAAISESSGNAKVTRGSVIDRINKERSAKGMTTFGDDIYKDIAGRDIAKSDAEYKAQSDRVSGRAPVMIGGSRVSQFENLSGDQLRRIAAQGQKPVASPAPATSSPSVTPVVPPEATRVPPLPTGPSIVGPDAQTLRRDKQLADYRRTKRDDYMKAWNATPDWGFVDPNSIANKTYKSVRTFLSGKSY